MSSVFIFITIIVAIGSITTIITRYLTMKNGDTKKQTSFSDDPIEKRVARLEEAIFNNHEKRIEDLETIVTTSDEILSEKIKKLEDKINTN